MFASESPLPLGEGQGEGGGQKAGPVNWYLTDARGSVRDVVQQGALSGGKMTAKVVDHVIYDAYGNASQAAAFATLACLGSASTA